MRKLLTVLGLGWLFFCGPVLAQAADGPAAKARPEEPSKAVAGARDRGLDWLTQH
jgi:hypothetical protein